MKFRLHSVGGDVRFKPSWKNFEEGVTAGQRSADILENTLIPLRTYENHSKVQPNTTLYSLISEKIPEEIPFQYFRWIAEQFKPESLRSLKLEDWILDETKYCVI